MDFDSPDVMKDFPGLYASDSHKAKGNDSDYSDDTEKSGKKEVLIEKRKDKKDKKDKERGYAALEGESSTEDSESRSPSKAKKSKSFKFSSKSKEKREKSRDKETLEKKKDKKPEKRVEKEKVKPDKKEKKLKQEDGCDIAEALPIFGVPLMLAIQRSQCHDGINLPLPVRACIDYVESVGLTFEGVYKVSAPKSKVAHIRKLYNQREVVDLCEYDVPTITSLFKMFIRDMGEPIFTADLLVRFEEAGAILNVGLREKHLKILVGNLPLHHKLLLSWIIVHLYNVSLNEKYNKMNAQSLSLALCSTFQTSHRLLTALLCHCPALFPDTVIEPYVPPLTSTAQLPSDPKLMEIELLKQESLLSQIHAEMYLGFISKKREELLWEVQRIITQLKRKLKISHKDKEMLMERIVDEKPTEEVVESKDLELTVSISTSPVNESLEHSSEDIGHAENIDDSQPVLEESTQKDSISHSVSNVELGNSKTASTTETTSQTETVFFKETLNILKLKNSSLRALRDRLIKQITSEISEISELKHQVSEKHIDSVPLYTEAQGATLDHIMGLLQKENQILQIKKINLVRQIMEQQEACIDLKTKLEILSKT